MPEKSRTPSAGAAIGSSAHRWRLGVTFLALLIAAMDATVVSAILPQVVDGVGGAGVGAQYAWLVSGFLISQVAATPVSGWIVDRFGSRVLMTGAATVFLAASVGAAMSTTMSELIAARVIHGVGAGALVVASYVVVGETFGPDRRASAQGALSLVWGVAAVVGPAVGAGVTAIAGWQWVFAINVPICLVVIVAGLVGRSGRRSGAARSGKGFPAREYALVLGFSILLMTSMQYHELDIGPGGGAAMALAGLACLIALRYHCGSLIPRHLFRPGVVQIALVSTFGSCVVMYSTITVLPVILADQGHSSTFVAAVVAIAAIGWVAGSTGTGWLAARTGLTTIAAIGTAALVLSAVVATFDASPWATASLAGAGTGLITASMLATMQNRLPPAQMGLATGAATMARSLGAAVGINGFAALSTGLSRSGSDSQTAFSALVVVAIVASIPAVIAGIRGRGGATSPHPAPDHTGEVAEMTSGR